MSAVPSVLSSPSEFTIHNAPVGEKRTGFVDRTDGRLVRVCPAKPSALSAIGPSRSTRRWAIWAERFVVGLTALVFAGWHLGRQGLGNLYYTSANISGAQSFRNLFFAAFDRGGIMAVDKPPFGLVAPALAIREFGVSSWTVLGPQVAMFALGVVLVHAALRRWTSLSAARLGALIMLLTPINIVVARSNNPDELLTLLAIVALICAVESVRSGPTGSWMWVTGCGVVVSLGFLTKFLQAFIAIPVFAAIFILSAKGVQRLSRTALFGSTVAIGSLSWIVLVDHVSSKHRPYVANSMNNGEFDLAFGFSGARRIGKITKSYPRGLANITHAFRNVFGGSYLRQASWLLPAALLGGVLVCMAARGLQRKIAASLLAWTVFHVLVFVVMPGKFSPYYLAPLVPGIAMLVALALDYSLDSLRQTTMPAALAASYLVRRNIALAIGGSTLVFVLLGVGKHNRSTLMGAALLLGFGVIGLNITSLPPAPAESRSSIAARCRAVANVMTVVCVSAGVLLAPARWSAAAVAHPQARTAPASSLDGVAPPTEEESIISANDRAIVAFVGRRSVGDSPILATSRVAVAAEIATGSTHAVAALGGFFGSGPLPTLRTLQGWILSRKIRWVAVPGLPPGRDPRMLSAGVVARPWGPYVRGRCRLVPARRYHGVNQSVFWRRYNHAPIHTPLSLYDCENVVAQAQ